MGQSFPSQSFFGGLFGVGFEQHFKDLLTGFTVMPELRGSQVTLNIECQFKSLAKQDADWEQRQSAISQAHTSTSVNIPLGEWVDISQINRDSYALEPAKIYDTQDVDDPKTHLLIRVDIAPLEGHKS